MDAFWTLAGEALVILAFLVGIAIIVWAAREDEDD